MINVKANPAFASQAGDRLHVTLAQYKVRPDTLPLIAQAVDTFEKELPAGKMDLKDSIKIKFLKAAIEGGFANNPTGNYILNKIKDISLKHPAPLDQVNLPAVKQIPFK